MSNTLLYFLSAAVDRPKRPPAYYKSQTMTAVRILFVLIAIPILTACSVSEVRQSPGDTVLANQRYASNLASYKESVRRGVIPSDYKTRVDRALARRLRDPDSRKVEFTRSDATRDYSGLVCGLVNARNGFGGFSGSETFGALFDASQRLVYLQIGRPEQDEDDKHIVTVDEDAYRSIARYC